VCCAAEAAVCTIDDFHETYLLLHTKRGIDDSNEVAGFRGSTCTPPSSAVFSGNADDRSVAIQQSSA
jgi:hypothetical protein